MHQHAGEIIITTQEGEEGKPYLIYCRKFNSLSAPEEIVLDMNALAQGHDFFSVGKREYSPDQKLLAYTVDTTGDERFTLYIKDIEADTLLAEEVYPVNDVEWANDNSTIFYVTPNEENLKKQTGVQACSWNRSCS